MKETSHALKRFPAHFLQRRLELLALPAADVAQPMVAVPEHFGEQRLDALDVVVEMSEQPLDVPRHRVVALDQPHRRTRGLKVQFGCILGDFRLRAELREHRHLARQRRAQRIDGLDAQSRRILRDAPPGLGVALQRRARELQRQRRMLVFRGFAGLRVGERFQHAFAHFAGGFPGKSDGDDLFGMVDARQQQQVALDQKLGLARSRRRLDDKRKRRIERAAAFGEVGNMRECAHASSPSVPSPSRGREDASRS